MRSLVVAVVVACVIAVVNAGVVELGERSSRKNEAQFSDFDRVVGHGKPAMVEFYDPECAHCRGFAPEYDQVAENLKDKPVVIGRVNVRRWDVLVKRFDISTVPAMRFFHAGDNKNCQPYPEFSEDKADAVTEYISGQCGFAFRQVMPTAAATAAIAAVSANAQANLKQNLPKTAIAKATCPVPKMADEVDVTFEETDHSPVEAVAVDAPALIEGEADMETNAETDAEVDAESESDTDSGAVEELSDALDVEDTEEEEADEEDAIEEDEELAEGDEELVDEEDEFDTEVDVEGEDEDEAQDAEEGEEEEEEEELEANENAVETAAEPQAPPQAAPHPAAAQPL
jgi:thiol-disulfide isomerase/thioredoxin